MPMAINQLLLAISIYTLMWKYNNIELNILVYTANIIEKHNKLTKGTR